MAEKSVSLVLEDDLVSTTRDIVARRSRVDDLLEKAEGKKGKVSNKIYDRVKADYSAQLRAIGEEYAPMCDRVQNELKRIRAEERRLRARLDVVNEELEEVRFRCEVGEYNDKELAEREKDKLDAIEELNEQIGTIDSTYDLARELLAADADAVLSGSTGEFAAEVAVDVGATSGVLHSATTSDAVADVTIDEPDGAEAAAQDVSVAVEEAPEPLDTTGAAADVTIGGGETALLKLKSENGEENFVLGDEALTIGRNPKNDIVLLDRTISRQHARVTREADGWVLTDLSSGGGLLINGKRVRSATMQNGDEIELGDFRFTFEG
jgi:hypothetical protein